MPFPDARYDPYTGSYGSWVFNDGSGSLPGTPEDQQSYFGLQDPGVNVVTGYGTPGATTTNYSSTPFFGFPDGGQTFISNDPAEIARYRENERTRNLQGALQVAALVGGGALGNALLGGAAGAGGSAAGGAASTYPLTTGPLASGAGAITATPIAAGGVGGISAGAVGAGGAGAGLATGPNGLPTGAVGGAATAARNGLPDWLANYAIPAINAGIGINASNNATDAMTAANQAAIDESRRQYDQSRTDLLPWLDAGKEALGQLRDPNASFMASPDYAFRRSEGTRGIENLFSAKGGARSGNALRALDEFNSGLASGEFGDWWNRRAGLAGVGQTTGTQLGTLGANNSTRVGSYIGDSGDARASGILGRGAVASNSITDIISNLLYSRGRRNGLPAYGG